MHSFEEIVLRIKGESSLLDHEIVQHFGHLNDKFKDFLAKLEVEDEQTKVAFHLVVQSTFHGRQLTHEEKLEIETQLKELLKTADLVALTVLPGGTIVLVLSSFLKLNPYILPAVFLSTPK
jgi:hypothetical protein